MEIYIVIYGTFGGVVCAAFSRRHKAEEYIEGKGDRKEFYNIETINLDEDLS